MAGKGKGKAKATGKKTTYSKSSNSGVTKLNADRYHRETLKGYFAHTGDNKQCKLNIPCIPSTESFPQWNSLKAKYGDVRVAYMGATVVFNQNEKIVMSVVERDPLDITTTQQMMMNTQVKTHSLDGDNKKVFRGWKPSTSSDYDFHPSSAPVAPASIKFLQSDLDENLPKCEVILTIVVECRNLNNPAGN